MQVNGIEHKRTDQQKKKILIVDDDSSITRVLSAVLGRFGVITVIDSGNKAIELLKTHSFDLILTDYEMEQGTGLDLLEYMKKQVIKTPTIMVTAFGTKELLMKTVGLHVYGFIEKPFTRETIEDLVKTALQTKEQDDKIESLALLGAAMGEIVHEISSPLTVLDLRIQELNETPAHADTDKMKRSVEKIKRIITSTKDAIRREYTQFKLSTSLKEARDEYEIRARQAGVSVSVEGDFDCDILGDKNRIRQVLVNLVNNAIDAAAESKGRWVNLQHEGDLITSNVNILVTDSGSGIPKELLDQLFQPLFSTKGKAGTGLGLSISKRIAVEHGGNIFLDTAHPQTRFVFSLPIPSKKEKL